MGIPRHFSTNNVCWDLCCYYKFVLQQKTPVVFYALQSKTTANLKFLFVQIVFFFNLVYLIRQFLHKIRQNCRQVYFFLWYAVLPKVKIYLFFTDF